MQMFYDTLAVVLAISIGIMVLSVFFWLLAKIDNKLRKPANLLHVKGILDKGQRINIHFNRSQTMMNVRFAGIISEKQAEKGGLPYQLVGMMVVEDAEQKRFLVKADTIRMVEQIADK